MAIICISILIICDGWNRLFPELLITLPVCCCIALLIAKTPKKMLLRFRLSPHIIISDEKLALEVWKDGNRVWTTKKISQVKKILDCGDVYYIIFMFGDITNSRICQKDNIVNGTIEEFEYLFQSKIVRKLK